jgi:hypothetical protein
MNDNYVLYMCLLRSSIKYSVYEIRIQNTRYILINDDNEWSFIADLQPCEKLKTIIIKTVKDQKTPISGRKSSLLQIFK